MDGHAADHQRYAEQLTKADRFLRYGQTTSSIVQSSPVPPRMVPLPGDEA